MNPRDEYITEEIKKMIKENYGSVGNFAEAIGVSDNTIYGVLNRGIYSASFSRVAMLSDYLKISLDGLSENKLIPLDGRVEHVSSDEEELLDAYRGLPEALRYIAIDSLYQVQNKYESLLKNMVEKTIKSNLDLSKVKWDE